MQGITRDRLRTAIAGSIMTAVFNCFNIFMIGYEEEESDKSSVTVTQGQ